MPLVRIALDVPGSAGNTRAIGHIRATPTRRRTVGDAIVLPAAFTAPLASGVVTVTLAANGADWCWKVEEMTDAPAIRFVAVPESDDTLGYEDLIDVDPDTLDPAVEPQAAWDIALDTLTADVDTIDGRVTALEDAPLPTTLLQGIALDDTTAVPPSTAAGTVVVRSVGAPPPVELELITASMTSARGDGTTATLAIPAGTATGDLLVVVLTNGITGGTMTPPAGWVTLARPTASEYRNMGFYGLPIGAIVPSVAQVFTMTSGRFVGYMARVTGADLVTPVLAVGTASSRTGAAITVPLLPGSTGGLVISGTCLNGPSPNTLIPVTMPGTLTKVAEQGHVDGTAVTRTTLTVATAKPIVNFAEHVVTAASSVASGASMVIALRAAA